MYGTSAIFHCSTTLEYLRPSSSFNGKQNNNERKMRKYKNKDGNIITSIMYKKSYTAVKDSQIMYKLSSVYARTEKKKYFFSSMLTTSSSQDLWETPIKFLILHVKTDHKWNRGQKGSPVGAIIPLQNYIISRYSSIHSSYLLGIASANGTRTVECCAHTASVCGTCVIPVTLL